MIGAIAGDIIGSIYEARPIKKKEFDLFRPECRFTDDTVLTVAVADSILNGGSYADVFRDYFHRYPRAGFGGGFRRWAASRSTRPNNSWGNGSAMRVSPVGFAFDDLETVLEEAEKSAAASHNHPEAIKGAQAAAAAVFLARTAKDKKRIRDFVADRFGYDLAQPLDRIRETYRFDVSCQGSVPQSIVAFLEADSYEDAVRNAISLGGDADTMAAIAGAIAEAFYGVPEDIRQRAIGYLDAPLLAVVDQFCRRFAR